jgi:hypothetical protein
VEVTVTQISGELKSASLSTWSSKLSAGAEFSQLKVGVLSLVFSQSRGVRRVGAGIAAETVAERLSA